MRATIRGHKRWSGKERATATRKTNEAIKKGIIPPTSDFPCRMCGRGKDEVYRMECHPKTTTPPQKI